MALGSMLVGMGFAAPSLVYLNDNLPYPIKILIHMGIGCLIFLIVALAVGWIPIHAGWSMILVTLALQLLIAWLIWFGYSRYHKRLARQMNEKIREKEQRHWPNCRSLRYAKTASWK